MPQPNIISDYLDTLTHELRFDTPLARRVRQEVEDHLWEAVAEAGDSSAEIQHRAVRNFGDPRDVAGEYAALSLFKQTRRTGVVVIFVAAIIWVAMKGRMAWNGAMHWSLRANLHGFARIDRDVFFLALVIGIVCWGYVLSRRISATFHAAYRDQLKRCVQLCVVATTALISSVIADTIMVTIRLSGGASPATAMVTLLSVAAEIVFAGMLVVQIRNTFERAERASSLLCD